MIYSSIDRAITYYIEDDEGHINTNTVTGASVKPSYVNNIAVTIWNNYSVTFLPGKYRIARLTSGSLIINWEEVNYTQNTTISTNGNHSFIIVCKI